MAERPRPGQIAVLTLLVGLAYAPLVRELAPQISVYFYFLIGLRLVSLRRKRFAPGRWLLLPLTLGAGINVYQAYHAIEGQEWGTALLASMLALKLLEAHRLRDIRLGTVLFGFLLISQFLFDQSPVLAMYLGGLLVANFALMVDLVQRAEGRPLRVPLGLAGRLTLQALPLALVLFVLFPRLSAPLWNLGSIQEKGVSGVKPWLEPGSISELVIEGELAFRARFDERRPAVDQLYWRGPVAWRTDGRRWTPAPRGTLGEDSGAPPSTGERVAYTMVLEPSGQRWLFPLDIPVRVPPDARVTADFQVLASKRNEDGRVVRMESALSYHTGALTPEQEQAGLQLPDNVTDRMRRLVAGWQQGAEGPEEVIQRGLRHFNEEPFHYTLLPPKLGSNPADEFLFETRRGFCEHYASSFALLMRIAGIPSRIVLGYMGGEHNPIGNYLIVRQSDAHAWVEVWLEGSGWSRVDPTASVAPGRVERHGFLDDLASGSPLRFRLDDPGTFARWVHNLGLLADAFDESWRQWVLGLDQARQQRLLDSAGLGFLREYGLAVAMVIAASVVLALLTLGLARRETRADPIEEIYARFCGRLARVGLARRPGEGPRDYARRVVEARPDLRDPVEAFIEVYLPLRYGAGQGMAQRGELERRLRALLPRRSTHGLGGLRRLRAGRSSQSL